LLGYGFAVAARPHVSRIHAIEPRLLDALIIAVGAWQQVWLWTANRPGSRAVVVPAALVFVLALLGRDHWPLGSRLVSFAALAVWAGYAPHSHGSTISYFAGVLLAFWVAGMAPEPRDALLAWAAGCALVAYATSVFPGGSVGDFFFSMLILSGLWLGAFTVGRRTRRARSLQQRLMEEQSEREARARRAVLEERTRIARELHDVVAHSLSVAIIQTVAARGELAVSEREGQVGHHLDAVESSCREALAEMRRLLDVLRAEADEPELGPAPGLASIDALVERVRGAGLQLEFERDGQPLAVAPGLDLAAYRIVQEALTNVLKHAPSAHAKLVLRYSTSGIDIEVLDDGQGARANGAVSGRGLIGMHERVALYGGALEAGPVAEGGFRVHAELPRAAETA
jgi:signal transduction histidine kinase